MIKKIQELLNEISVLDIFPKQFKKFIEKYKSHQNDPTLFVNFSSFKNDPLDKRFASSSGFHRDPEGLYVYPLEYIINHPADLKFGENRESLVVIRSKSKKTLDLQKVDTSQALYDLEKLGIVVPEAKWDSLSTEEKKVKKTEYWFKNKSNTMRAGALLYYFARNILNYGEDGIVREELINGSEQSNQFKKLGYDFILDTAKTPRDAIIHENEPEQGVFLTRNSYEVVEIFKLRDTKIDNWGGTASNYMEMMSKKIFGLFAQKFNTGIQYAQKVGYYGEKRAVLKNGIGIKLEATPEKEFGTTHRQVRDELNMRIKVTLEGKVYSSVTFFPYESLNDLINKSVERYYDKIKENNREQMDEINKNYPNLIKIANAMNFKKDINLLTLEDEEVIKIKNLMKKVSFALIEEESFRIPSLLVEVYGKKEPPVQLENLIELYTQIRDLNTKQSEGFLIAVTNGTTSVPPNKEYTKYLIDSLK